MQRHAIFKAADVVIGILIETRDVPDEGSCSNVQQDPGKAMRPYHGGVLHHRTFKRATPSLLNHLCNSMDDDHSLLISG